MAFEYEGKVINTLTLNQIGLEILIDHWCDKYPNSGIDFSSLGLDIVDHAHKIEVFEE